MVTATIGEIRVKVRLTNAVDEALARRGRLEPSAVRTYEAEAMVDTGAVRSVIPIHVLQQLGVEERGRRVAEYADGRKDSVGVTEPIIFDLLGRDTLEEALVLGDEVLIGQTVLEKLDLLADCQGRRLVSNPAHPDQPVTKVKHQTQSKKAKSDSDAAAAWEAEVARRILDLDGGETSTVAWAEVRQTLWNRIGDPSRS